MRPLALDLCCGIWEGGWANGLVKAGWQVIGVDIEDQGGYVGHKILADVREIAKDPEKYFPALKFDLVVASPPCQEFSASRQPFNRPHNIRLRKEGPNQSIWLACKKIAEYYKVPYFIENVLGAERWMKPAAWHYGSFYFWGTIPALKPIPFWQEDKKKWSCHKGFHRVKKTSGLEHTGGFKWDSNDDSRWISGGVNKEKAALAAMIPEELSTWIGECFYRGS